MEMAARALMYARGRKNGKARNGVACPDMNDHGTSVPAFGDEQRAGRVSSRNVASMRPR